jgi:nucleolar protein 56
VRAAQFDWATQRFLGAQTHLLPLSPSPLLQATSKFGDRLRDQVEERLRFYESGDAPRRNIDVMHGVFEELAAEEAAEAGAAAGADGGDKSTSKKSKKHKKGK